MDYAVAVVGFSFKGGYSAPKTDGIVVCKEASTLVMEGYERHRILQEQRQTAFLQQEEQKQLKIR